MIFESDLKERGGELHPGSGSAVIASSCAVRPVCVRLRPGVRPCLLRRPLFGRMQGTEGAERALGLFINTLPVRIKMGTQGIEQSLRQTHESLSALLHHETLVGP